MPKSNFVIMINTINEVLYFEYPSINVSCSLVVKQFSLYFIMSDKIYTHSECELCGNKEWTTEMSPHFLCSDCSVFVLSTCQLCGAEEWTTDMSAQSFCSSCTTFSCKICRSPLHLVCRIEGGQTEWLGSLNCCEDNADKTEHDK